MVLASLVFSPRELKGKFEDNDLSCASGVVPW